MWAGTAAESTFFFFFVVMDTISSSKAPLFEAASALEEEGGGHKIGTGVDSGKRCVICAPSDGEGGSLKPVLPFGGRESHALYYAWGPALCRRMLCALCPAPRPML